MQLQHRCLHFSFDDGCRDIQCALQRFIDQDLFFLARRIQHEIDYLGTIAGMTDAAPEARPEGEGK